MEFNWRPELNETIPFEGDYIYKIFADGDETIELSFDNGLTFIRPNTFKLGVKGWQLRFTQCQGIRYFLIRNYATGCTVDSKTLQGEIHVDCGNLPIPLPVNIPVPIQQPIPIPIFIPVPIVQPIPLPTLLPVPPPVPQPLPIPVPVVIPLPIAQPIPLPVQVPVPEVALYANPTYGVGTTRLGCNGTVEQTYMNLELNGNLLRDITWSSDYNVPQNGYEKIYHIGWFDRNDTSTYWTKEQFGLQGVDISAYRGREITVFAIWRSQAEPWKIAVFEQQTIFIPKSNNLGTIIESGKVYHKFPHNRIWKQSSNAYFEEYINSINDNRMAVLQFSTYAESVLPKYQSMGMYGKYGNAGKRMQLVGDAIFTDYLQYGSGQPFEKHPQAYNENLPPQYPDNNAWWADWLPNFKAYWGSQARQKVIDIFDLIDTTADYSFVNNELFGFWETDSEFMSWVRDGYQYFIQKSGGKKIGAWLASRAKFPRSSLFGDPSYFIPDTRTKTYNDLVFNSGGNWNNYLAKPDKFLEVKPTTDLSYGTNVQQVGNYQYYPDLKAGTFFALIVELMLFERHGMTSDVLPTWWHSIELSYYANSRAFKRYDNKTYYTGIKPEVGAETEYQIAAIVKFFNKNGLIDMWSDPIVWSKEGDNPNSIPYPEFNVSERTCSGDIPASFPSSVYRVPFTRLVANVNNFMDALSLPVFSQYINYPVQAAEVYWNNTWRQNINMYPVACMEDKAPFVAYRRAPDNRALVFAWAYSNHQILNVGIKIDNTDYTIRIEGCYPTIVELDLGNVIPVPIPVPQPLPIPVPLPVSLPQPVPVPLPQIPLPVDTNDYVFHHSYMEGNPYLQTYYNEYRNMIKNQFLGEPVVQLEFPSNPISYNEMAQANVILYSTVSLYDSSNRLIIQSSREGVIEGDEIWGNNHGCYFKIPEGTYRVVIEFDGSNPSIGWLQAECFRQDANSPSPYYDYGLPETIGHGYPSNSKEFTFNTAGVKEQPSGLIKINNVSR